MNEKTEEAQHPIQRSMNDPSALKALLPAVSLRFLSSSPNSADTFLLWSGVEVASRELSEPPLRAGVESTAGFLDAQSWRGVLATPGTYLIKVLGKDELVKEDDGGKDYVKICLLVNWENLAQ